MKVCSGGPLFGPDQIQTLFCGQNGQTNIVRMCTACHYMLCRCYLVMSVPYRVYSTLLTNEEAQELLEHPPN